MCHSGGRKSEATRERVHSSSRLVPASVICTRRAPGVHVIAEILSSYQATVRGGEEGQSDETVLLRFSGYL